MDNNDNSRSTSFQAVTGPRQQDVPGGPLLIAAYAVLWAVVFGYVFYLSRLQRKVENELEDVRRSQKST